MGKYDAIIGLSRPESARPKRDRSARAKQFMPFASLKGYGDLVRSREAVLIPKPELSEEKRAALDHTLLLLRSMLQRREKPLLDAEVFEPANTAEADGAAGTVRRIRGQAERLSLQDETVTVSGERIPLRNILALRLYGTEAL